MKGGSEMETRTYTCYQSGCNEPAKGIGYPCEKHQAEHRARWKEEHTRKPGDTRKGWLIGDLCTVKLRGQQYNAKITDMSDISRHENNYDLVKLELTKTVTDLGGKTLTQTWTHPEPVQTYKLKKRVV